MEYVRIDFETEREVHMDGNELGPTNQTLMVEAGTHLFNLGQPRNYTPRFRKVAVEGTTSIKPLVLAFQPKDTS